MMKKIYLLLTAFCMVGMAYSQQQAMYTQYMFNQLAINPAYTGIHDGISTSLLWREQWVGFEGAPRTQTASIHSPISFRPVSVGFWMMRDEIGKTAQNSANLTYAYRIALADTYLSFGLQASFSFYQTNFNNEGILDPIFNGSNVNTSHPNFGTGIMWHGERFYLGASVPYLLNQELDSSNPDISSNLVRHYFITGGWVLSLGEQVLIKPNFMVKAVEGAPIQGDINVNVLLKNALWVGLSYRSLESLAALTQLQLGSKIQIGYAFDFMTMTDLSQVQSGSHELMINYVFERKKTKILTPRYY